MVDRGHPQYAGKLSLDQRLHLIRQGHGRSGANRDYVLATVAELEALGCRDAELHALAEKLKAAAPNTDRYPFVLAEAGIQTSLERIARYPGSPLSRGRTESVSFAAIFLSPIATNCAVFVSTSACSRSKKT